MTPLQMVRIHALTAIVVALTLATISVASAAPANQIAGGEPSPPHRRGPAWQGPRMFMDLPLAQRLERAEGSMCTTFIEPRNAYEAVGAVWRDFAGTTAIFDGIDSPLTQTFGLGMFGPAGDSELVAIEAFFAERGAPTMHEVSPFAGIATLATLVARGYQPIDLTTVLVREIDEVSPPVLPARMIDPAVDGRAWVEASVAGWSSDPEVLPFIRTIAEVNILNRSMKHFVVERAGEAIATGALGIQEGVAMLVGAATVTSARGLGAQAALLSARLAYAREHGCTVAMMGASVGSTSQRNAERRGFRVAYTRTKWRRALGG